MRRGSRRQSDAGEPAANERGFALLIVFLMAAAIAFTFYLQLPRVAFESQRDKEELLIERGEQYKRAIKLYVIAYQRFPAKIEDLENTNQKRYLRRRYIDPMTGKDEWRLIHVNAAGLLTDSLVQKPPANPTGQLAGSSANATGPGTNVGNGANGGLGTNTGIGTNPGLGTNGALGTNAGATNAAFPTGSPNPFNPNGANLDAQQQVNAAVLRRPSDRLFNPAPVTPQNQSVQPQDDPANWPPISLFPAQGQNGQAIQQGQQQPFGQQPFGQQPFGQPNGQPGAPQQINPQFNTQFPGQQAPGQQFPIQQFPNAQQFQPQPFQVQQAQQLPVQQPFPGQQQPFPGQQPFNAQQVQQQIQQQNSVDPLQPQFPSDQQAVVQPEPFQVQPGGALPGTLPAFPVQPQQPGQAVSPNQFPGQPALNPQNAVQNQVRIGPDGQFIPVQNLPGQIPGAQASGANPVQAGVQQPAGGAQFGGGGAGAGTQNSALDAINKLLMNPSQAPTGLGSNNNGGIGAGIAGVASSFKGPSIKVYGDRSKYNEWEFVFDLKSAQPAAALPAGQNNAGQNNGGQGTANQNNTGQNNGGPNTMFSTNPNPGNFNPFTPSANAPQP